MPSLEEVGVVSAEGDVPGVSKVAEANTGWVGGAGVGGKQPLSAASAPKVKRMAADCGLLNSKIRFLYHLIFLQVRGRITQHDLAGLEHVTAMRD